MNERRTICEATQRNPESPKTIRIVAIGMDWTRSSVARLYLWSHRGWAAARANAHLIAAAPELYLEHHADDKLLMQMATVILNDKIADYVPFGLADAVKARLSRGTPAIAKALGTTATAANGGTDPEGEA